MTQQKKKLVANVDFYKKNFFLNFEPYVLRWFCVKMKKYLQKSMDKFHSAPYTSL